MNRITCFIAKSFGRRVIVCKRLRDGEWWYTYVMKDPFDGEFAYRYPLNRIGQILLNENGSGNYCGEIIWKDA